MLIGALLLGALGGGGAVVCGVSYRDSGRPVATVVSPPQASLALQVKQSEPDEAAAEPRLTDRERQVLARLARLPDLPLVQTPAFDVKVNEAVPAPATADAPAAGRRAAGGESVLARIQVVSVEKGRVFYRSVDDQVHTARPGERLLGVNGRVLAIDEQGAELQIDGQHMRVAANNL